MSVQINIVRQVDDTAEFRQQVVLDDVTYTLHLRWNVRSLTWEMDVLDAAGTTVHQAGLALRADWPLNAYIPGKTPDGYFYAIDTGAAFGDGVDPGFDDLGSRVQLVYTPSSELG